jgi:hypothetical protein
MKNLSSRCSLKFLLKEKVEEAGYDLSLQLKKVKTRKNF